MFLYTAVSSLYYKITCGIWQKLISDSSMNVDLFSGLLFFQNNFHQECIEGLKTILILHIITCYNNNRTHKYNKQTKNHATRHDAKHYCKLYKNNTAYVLMPLTISTRASFPDHICKPTYTPFGCQKDTCHWRKSFRAFSQPPLQYKQ